jgi:hypothetical protein
VEICQAELCSVVSQSLQEDPIGVAGAWDLVIMMELPLPWPKELWRANGFPRGLYDQAVAARERGLNLTFLCVAPDPAYAVPGRRRVLLMRKPGAPFARYDRAEYLLPEDQLLRFFTELFSGEDPEAVFRVDSGAERDLFVCTHGSVDAACGKFGFPIYQTLRDQYAAPSAGRLRVWRVSHFGGHRFAPTVLDYPEGRCWAHLNPTILDQVVRHEGPISALRMHYRGWGGLSTPFEQVAERAIWEREGWAWIDYLKAGWIRHKSPDGERAELTIAFRSPDGQVSGRYEATVEISHRLSTLGRTGGALMAAPQYRVTQLVRYD